MKNIIKIITTTSLLLLTSYAWAEEIKGIPEGFPEPCKCTPSYIPKTGPDNNFTGDLKMAHELVRCDCVDQNCVLYTKTGDMSCTTKK